MECFWVDLGKVSDRGDVVDHDIAPRPTKLSNLR
jgi:hypothetical protein